MNASAYLIEENVTQIKSGIVIVRENKIEDSQIKCDETINEADSVSTNVPTNVMSAMLTNFCNKKYSTHSCNQ